MSEQHSYDPTSPNSGCGWVYRRPDGLVAKCGGPTVCKHCKADHEQQDKQRAEDALQADGFTYNVDTERGYFRDTGFCHESVTFGAERCRINLNVAMREIPAVLAAVAPVTDPKRSAAIEWVGEQIGYTKEAIDRGNHNGAYEHSRLASLRTCQTVLLTAVTQEQADALRAKAADQEKLIRSLAATLESVRQNDATPRYEYTGKLRARPFDGAVPESGRWMTPREIVEDRLRDAKLAPYLKPPAEESSTDANPG